MDKGLNRRGFLKATATAGAVFLLGDILPREAIAQTKVPDQFILNTAGTKYTIAP